MAKITLLVDLLKIVAARLKRSYKSANAVKQVCTFYECSVRCSFLSVIIPKIGLYRRAKNIHDDQWL